jgi:glycosyltransferase involved in cell wall biosynthesis
MKLAKSKKNKKGDNEIKRDKMKSKEKKHNNPKTLAKELQKIIDNPNIRKDKEANALEFAREHCDWGENARRLEEWMKIK